jgi:hypothetical protein
MNEVRKFARRVVGFTALQVAIAAVLISGAFWLDRFPPPRLTGNRSFDEKILFLRKHPERLAARTLIAGSSLSLAAILGEDIEKAVPEAGPVLNVGVWGERMIYTRSRVQELRRWIRPDVVIVGLAPPAFTRDEPDFGLPDPPQLERVLRAGPLLPAYLHAASPLYYVREALFREADDHGNPYLALAFDRTGSAPLRVRPGDEARFGRLRGPSTTELDPRQYEALTGLADDVARDGAQLVVVELPIRPDVTARQDLREYFERHRQSVAAALSKTSARQLTLGDGLDLTSEDFADWLHLGESGAEKLTRALANDLRQIVASHSSRLDPPHP